MLKRIIQKTVVLFVILHLSCRNSDNGFEISGVFKDIKSRGFVFLYYAEGNNYKMDSTRILNGKFEFNGKVSCPDHARLEFKRMTNNREDLPKKDVIHFFIENAKINVLAIDSLKSGYITGSKVTNDYNNLEKTIQTSTTLFDSEITRKIPDALERHLARTRNIYVEYAENNRNSFMGIWALKQALNMKYDYFKSARLFKSFSPELQKTPVGWYIRRVISGRSRGAIGKMAIDFSQPDSLGVKHRLSDFKGKVVLVEVWASWCAACPEEHENIKKALAKYGDRNDFAVMGVALENPGDQNNWKRSIREQGINWLQVSDFKGPLNLVAEIYGIRSVPESILIDKQGKILGRKLRGEDLDVALENILKTN